MNKLYSIGLYRFLRARKFFLSFALIFVFAPAFSQTTVTVTGGASGTCPFLPTAVWTTAPTGVSFSNWSRGAGVACASANNGLSGSGFNTASAAASYSANRYYSVTISADASHSFTLNSVLWNTTISGTGSATFDVEYINNGGALTQFGPPAQTGTGSPSFNYTGSVNVGAGTSIVLYLIPSNAAAATTTIRWLNGSTITLTAALAASITPTPSTFTGLNYSFGTGPSAASAFTLLASNLTAGGGTITATAPLDYEVSTTSATSGFGNTAMLTYTGTGTLAANTVWVRLKAGLAQGNYNSETVNIAGGGGNATVTVSGTVTAAAFVSVANGDWNVGSTWSTGTVPTSTDNVVISSANTVYTTTSLSRAATTTVNGGFELRNGGYASGSDFTYAATGSTLIFNVTSGTYVIGSSPAYWPATGSPYNVTIPSGSAGADLSAAAGARTINGTLSIANFFNIGAAGGLTVNGTLLINTGGYINSNSPGYGSGSLLQYNTNGVYNRLLEWTSASATVGTPYNVQLSNNTTLGYPGSTPAAQTVSNNLVIDAGSSLYMNYGGVTSNGALTVGGNFILSGNFTGGYANGDDLKIGGNITLNSGYNFYANNRAVIFTKPGGTQVINAASTPTFAYLNLSPSSGTGIVQLAAGTSINVSAPLGGNVISFTNAGDILDINGNTLTLGTTGVANAISGPGSFKGSTTSNLSLLGSGSLGTINFAAGFQNLGTLTINRTAGALAAALGTDVTVNTSVAFTAGILNVNASNLIFGASATSSSSSANSFAEADGTGTVRKLFSGTGSFTYPVGDNVAPDGAQYSPATFNFTSGSFASAYVGINVQDIKHPANTIAASYVTRYWAVTSSGVSNYSCDLSFTYTPADVTGTESAIKTGEYQNPGWAIGNTTNVATHTLSVTGEGAFAQAYTGGDNFTPIVSKPTDYFRSLAGGNWAVPGTWESSPTGTAPWITSTLVPTSVSAGINILATHTVAVTSSISLDQTVISGVLEIQAGGILNINDGAGDDITINSGGIFRTLGNSPYATEAVYSGAAVIHTLSGGKLTVGTGAAVAGSGLAGYAFSANNLWDDNAVFEWNATNPWTSSNIIYFPTALTTIPIFRFSAASSGGGGGTNTTTWNGKLEVNANTTFMNTADKIVRNGISGTATLTATACNIKITGANAVLDGSSLNLVLTVPMYLSSSVNVPDGAFVTVSGSSIDNNATPGNLTVNGTLDITNVSITNPAGIVTVNGTLRTSHAGGLSGSGSAIVSGTVNLGAASTIEYYTAGAQLVTNRTDYNNIIISGVGTKTLATSSVVTPISGTVTVSNGSALDVSNTTFGSGSTNLTLLGSGKFLNAGAGVKPDIGGLYNLGSGSTIEFDGSSATLVRLVNYYNLYIAGSNVTTSTNTAVINLQAGGTFTIAATGKFKTRNSNGFSGGSSTSVGNGNSPLVVLAPGSTIDYSEPIAQTITNALPYSNLDISAASGAKAAPAGTLSILGNLTKSGAAVFTPNNGTVSFDGTAATTQSISTVDSVEFYKMLDNNINGGVTAASGDIGIHNLLTLAASAKLILSAGYINLRSTASATGAVDAIPASASLTYSGNGRFRVERFVGYLRKWQLLGVPVTEDILAAPTFRSTWMEGSVAPNDNLVPGRGMQITDNGSGWMAAGFDAHSISGPSVKSYVPATNGYLAISSPSNAIGANAGYFAFVRGDRAALNTNSLLNLTRLRLTGKIYTGAKTISDGTATSGLYQVIGNPYPAAVNLQTIGFANTTTSNGKGNVYVWDPTIAGNYGYGKFVLLSYTGSNYIADDNTGLYSSSSVTNYIQSGQAFLVQSAGGVGSVSFAETDKAGSASSATVNFLPGNTQMLRTALYTLNNGVNANGADGAVVLFGDNMSSALDAEDAVKLLNSTDNLALSTGGKLLGIERRHTITADDTLHLDISAMRVMKYRFVVAAENLDAAGRSGFLIDRLTSVETPLSLAGNTQYDFDVTADAASSAHDRFMIVFKQRPAPKFIIVEAAPNPDKTIGVSWQTGNENNVNLYQIQRSPDGISFADLSSTGPRQNNGAASTAYNFIDSKPLHGENYYRVKMLLNDGTFIFSDAVKVSAISDAVYIAASPNPVRDKIIHLQLSNQARASYSIQLLNAAGEQVYRGSLEVKSYLQSAEISLSPATAPGIYRLVITNANFRQSIPLEIL